MPDSNCRRIVSPVRVARVGAVFLLGAICFGRPGAAVAQNKRYADEKVEQTIRKAIAFLKKEEQKEYRTQGYVALAAYALLKSNEPAASVRKTLDGIAAKVKNGEYTPRSYHIYEAGVDVMALEAADPKRYASEIKAIADYLLKNQRPEGQWGYPGREYDNGDTSITQYAILGLWTASRAGIEIPVDAWERAARWLMRTQHPNGGFVYHPNTKGTNPNVPRNVTHSMVVAGASSLYLVRMMMFPKAKELTDRRNQRGPGETSRPKKKRVVIKSRYLIPIDLDEEEPAPPTAPTAVDQDAETEAGVKLSSIDEHLRKSRGWMINNFTIKKATGWPIYYLYGLERLSAFGNIETYGEHDWYEEGAIHFVATQNDDGSWTGPPPGQLTAQAATAFALLFLERATAKTIGRTPRRLRMGTGLLAGGRGLPDNLGEVEMKNGELKVKKSSLPVESLLADLERLDFSDVDTTQKKLVEQVQLGDREELIGQIGQLKRLVKDPRPEIRQTAVWALGRSAQLTVAPILIKALSDRDVVVNEEARNALCVLSRKPDGFKLPARPLAGVDENAPESVRDEAVAKWRAEATAKWTEWYRSVQPYDERDGLRLSEER